MVTVLAFMVLWFIFGFAILAVIDDLATDKEPLSYPRLTALAKKIDGWLDEEKGTSLKMLLTVGPIGYAIYRITN
jgi:hypothetical protein